MFGQGPSKKELIQEGNKILAKKMSVTQKHMQLVMYKLGRLIQDENSLHRIIETGPFARPSTLDILEGIPYYFKIKCTEGYVSPIVIHLFDLSEK